MTTNILYIPSRQVSNMNEGVIKGSKDVCNTKYILSFSNLWSELDVFFLLGPALSLCHAYNE